MTLAKIKEAAPLEAQIRASRENLKELYRKRAAIQASHRPERTLRRKLRDAEILRLFDHEDMPACAIARQMDIPDSRVRQFLRSRGRTRRGRELVRSQMALMGVGK